MKKEKVFTAILIGIVMTTGGKMTEFNTEVKADISSEFEIPQADEAGRIGASMPYLRYDSKDAEIGNGAKIEESVKSERTKIASQASQQSYVSLPVKNSYAEWTAVKSGSGVTMRFTMPDSTDGKGLTGSLDVYVNGEFCQKVDLTSYYMWQYFAGGNPSDKNNGGVPCFAFDEVHFILNKTLNPGDKIRVQNSGRDNLIYGVDFVEIEEVPQTIAQPANSLNVVDYGAKPNDGKDDYNAIRNCISAANIQGKDVYFPEGTFNIGRKWTFYGKNIKVTGAGMWYTNIQFTNSNANSGGIAFAGENSCYNVEFCNMYINSNLSSRYNEQASYKCFSDVPGNGSVIHDIWEDHFECGFWLGDYSGTVDYSDGMKIINCRIRNNLADGVNFCQGTSNSVVYNCSIRNNGDDGLACWNNNYLSAKDETGNVFAYNTIDFIWRAGGIAIYGGDDFNIYNNYICDTFMASGIHLNTTFDGHKFNNTKNIKFENNTLVRCGTYKDSWGSSLAAIDISQNVKNISFSNTKIYDAWHDGVVVKDNVQGIKFENTVIYGSGTAGQKVSGNAGAAIKSSGSPKAEFDNISITNSAYNHNDKPYLFTGSYNGISILNELLYNNLAYEVPGYPEVSDVTKDEETIKPGDNETTPGNDNRNDTGNLMNSGTSSNSETVSNQNDETKKKITKNKPGKVKIKSVKKTKGKMKITLKKLRGVYRYQIKVSTSKKFVGKNTRTKNVKGTKAVFKKINVAKKYYVKARAYKIVEKKRLYGRWSGVVSK